MTTIVWFRRDLRLTHNSALNSALEHGDVIPVYIHAPEEEAPWQPGAASNWWLHHSLNALQDKLKELGSQLIVRQGPSLETLKQLIQETGATHVTWNRMYEPACIKRDLGIKAALKNQGISVNSYNAALIFEPWQIENKAGAPFRVFTPFWKHYLARLESAPITISAAPKTLNPTPSLNSEAIDDLKLLPTIAWDKQFYQHWQPGEAGALANLAQHLQDNIDDYKRDRDIPSLAATSRLSPHLHFGEISPQQILLATQQLPPASSDSAINSRKHFLSEVGWREFAYHLLYHFPDTATQPLNRKYQQFPWWRSGDSKHPAHQQAEHYLTLWQQGETGISLVDAGMQELWQSGWMHNRVRMVVASLLSKNMGIHWSEGARWFWDTLVDADLASNTLGWQWAAGCGADAAPYFRIFNPETQAQRFDPTMAYRNRWLASGWQQRAACLDVRQSRQSALAAYDHIKNQA